MAFEVTLNEFDRFLVRRVCSALGHHDAVWKYAGGTAGRVVVAIPLLDDFSVHVDDDHSLGA